MSSMNPQMILAQIRDLFVSNPEIAEDEQLLADMVEGSTDLYDFMRRVERRRFEIERMAEGVAAEIKHVLGPLGERKANLERREEGLRALMLKVLEAAHVRKLELPEATISRQEGRESVVIIDEASVPRELCRVKYTPDKTAIRELLEGGEKPNWAALVMGPPHVVIRR